MNKTKLKTLLKPNHILRADRICAPEGLVEVFAIPATEFGSAVIDVIKWTTPFEDALQLAEVGNVATRVQRQLDVGTQAEADLVGLMLQIARDDMMTALTKLFDKAGADCAETACYENSHAPGLQDARSQP